MNIKLTNAEAVDLLRDHFRHLIQVEPIVTIESAVTANWLADAKLFVEQFIP